MATLRSTLEKKIPEWRKEIADVRKTLGDKVISQVTVNQAYGGMRGVKGMICDTSVVEPDKGLIIREAVYLSILGFIPALGLSFLLYDQAAQATQLPMEMTT